MVASVPLLTMRTFSTLGTHAQIVRRHLDLVGVGNAEADAAFAAASAPRRAPPCGAWPRIAGPQVPT